MRVLKEGTRLADRYTLIRRLGTGGMSEVWLAHDRQSASSVALKFLSPALSSQAAYRENFHKEWQTGTRLMHAHIARVFEYHDDPDGPFYSQQYIGGPALSIVAGRPIHESLRPFGFIADALRYAHGKDIVHRDIKASNILLDGRGSPYLIDFGVAMAAGADGGTGGSPVAASPERLSGAPPAPADDIYALGVLLHETIFGQPPERTGRQNDASPIADMPVDDAPLPDELKRLLGDMLAADAAARPSADEVSGRLRDAGIEPGPAIVRVAETDPDADNDVAIELLQSIRPVKRNVTTPPDIGVEGRAGRGVSHKFLFGGLAALALVFVSVFYLLPNGSDTDGVDDTGPPSTADEATAPPNATSGDNVAGSEEPLGSETDAPRSQADTEAIKAATDDSLGELLSSLERLRLRAIERWGGQAFQDALDVYELGDQAYLNRDYQLAGDRYREALELLKPFFNRIEVVFNETMQAAKAAFADKNHADAVRLFDLAVAITPGNREAEAWLSRARNLASVLTLTDQGLRFESDLELNAAKLAFEKALKLDPAWQPAAAGLERIVAAIRQRSFERRMTEGLDALADGNLQSARAAFNAAKALMPESRQPVDGLLQVDQEIRLASIRRKELQAQELENSEQWHAAVLKYKEILEIDPLLQFAKEGLARADRRAAMNRTLESYIARPDSLSAPATMQAATNLFLEISRMTSPGPRLIEQKNELARLLKRAATPLTVRLLSDNATEVAIFQVGKLGTFSTQEIQLRPGTYVAKGSRDGFRDVRLEFRVAPEIELEPIVIQCEERI